jgi:hypothetical protein
MFHPIDGLDQEKDREGDDREVDEMIDEHAVPKQPAYRWLPLGA